jgi:manganese-dependent inorganic pyrophosphatase
MRPLASTASVIYETIGEEEAMKMPDSMLGLMLSCILSDTLAFRSPTTTSRDQEIAERIAAKLDINIDAYADKMFTAKSDVSEYSDEQLITLDSKKFEVGGKNLRVSSLETTKPELVLARKSGLIDAMKGMVAKGDADEALLFIVDILKEEATVLVYNETVKTIIEKSFNVTVSGDTVVLPGVVSRKKQIIPVLKV